MKAGEDTPYLRKQRNFNENVQEMKTSIIFTHHELIKKMKVVYVRVKMDVVWYKTWTALDRWTTVGLENWTGPRTGLDSSTRLDT